MLQIGQLKAPERFLETVRETTCDQWGWGIPHAYIALSARAVVFFYFDLVGEEFCKTQILFYFSANNAKRVLAFSPDHSDLGILSKDLKIAWREMNSKYYEELINLQAKLREELNEAA